MSKKFLLIVLLMFLFPLSAKAHTTLLSSTPSEGENMSEALTEVKLVFGTKIEEGSTMSVESEKSSFEFDEITIENDVMTGKFSKTLPKGSYHILWNIIGEDGHPIEGEITFGMAMETGESEKAEEVSNTNDTAIKSEEKTAELQTEKNSNLPMTILLVLAAVLAVYGIYKLLWRKK